jgi:hypothetical protein
MVRPGGLELPTFWFVARRSIQLSYGRTGMNAGTIRCDRKIIAQLEKRALSGESAGERASLLRALRFSDG